jgi:hypothetical protein
VFSLPAALPSPIDCAAGPEILAAAPARLARALTTSQPRKGDVTGCQFGVLEAFPVVSGGCPHPTGWWGHPDHRKLPREVPGTRDPTTARYIRCLRGMREARGRSPPSHHWTPAPRVAAPWPRLARRAVL